MTTAECFYSVDDLVKRENLPRRGNIPTLAAGVRAPRGFAGDANSATGGRGRPLCGSRFDAGRQKEPEARNAPRVPFGDPWENRTPVTAVKGRCLNLLTNGPGSGSRI